MTEKDRKKSIKGFTLLEVLIAIFIFSIIVSTVFLSYNSLFSRVGIIQNIISKYEMARNCLSRMTDDLSSIYLVLLPEYSPPYFNGPLDPHRIVSKQAYVEEKSFHELRFSSHAHLPIDNTIKQGIARIIYYVEKSEEYGYVLKRSDRLYPYLRFEEDSDYDEEFIKKKTDPVLCENVKSLVFKFVDQDKQEYEQWDSESDEYNFSTPLIIRIELEIGNDAESRIFQTDVKIPVVREKIQGT